MELTQFLQQASTPSLVKAISGALNTAEGAARRTSLAHLADALLGDESVAARLDADLSTRARASLAEQLVAQAEAPPGAAGEFAFDVHELIDPALALARDWGAEKVSPLTFLATVLSSEAPRDPESSRARQALRSAGLTMELLSRPVAKGSAHMMDATFKPLGFGRDLTALARAGFWATNPLVGYESELKRLVTVLNSGADSAVLVGEPGVGKSALVAGLAYHIAARTRPLIPPSLDSWTIVRIEKKDIMAGTGVQGELEQRLNMLLTFFRKNPGVIPFLEEIHTLLDTDDPASRNIANTLKTPMADGLFRCVGATTDREYARFIANDDAMNSRFTKILLGEPDAETAFRIIGSSRKNLIPAASQARGIELDDEAIRTGIRVTMRYQRNDRLPRKAIRLLRSVVSQKSYDFETSASPISPVVTGSDVAHFFSEVTGIPMDDLADERSSSRRLMAERLSARVRGQGEAVKAVTSWLSFQATGWVDPRRPRGRFLFLGPPGVGKTELALCLAEEVMRDRGSLIVKNMAEYKGEGARTRFMGADPGYKGYGEVPTVYSRVMMRPYSVVVFDEFEKSDPSLGDPLLSMFDGQGEDSQARRVDFSQCIFVMTSNALTAELKPAQTEEDLRAQLRALGGIWSPPLVDRIDRIVLFNPLEAEAVAEILDDLIARRRAAASRPLPAEIDAEETRRTILTWALEGEASISARRLERALQRWLSAAVDSADSP